jgi:DNA repair/transcription protein MET18/MMS19
MRFRDALFEAAKDEAIGWTAAKAIGEIVAVDGVLTKKNHAIVKVRLVKILWIATNRFQFLYAQKYVSQVLPRIVANARDSDGKL